MITATKFLILIFLIYQKSNKIRSWIWKLGDDCMGKVYKLNSEKSLAHQVLEYAGWYEGRKVDVEK